ncbi:MAG TPA: PIN domain-containing protein [Solirubrobacterales bacterium]|nr:PIN domain-containing protein [Solirubrobacterales bacterium]
MYCFDTDVLSATIRREPSLPLIRRLAQVPPTDQFTTAITMGELLYGAARRDSKRLNEQVRELLRGALTILPFDETAAAVYGPLRASLESEGKPLAEPDLRIASIALSRDLAVVTGNIRHFARIPDLTVENWLS